MRTTHPVFRFLTAILIGIFAFESADSARADIHIMSPGKIEGHPYSAKQAPALAGAAPNQLLAFQSTGRTNDRNVNNIPALGDFSPEVLEQAGSKRKTNRSLSAGRRAKKYQPHIAADPTDPFIIAQASQLGNNPNTIFAFVRDQIGFDVYYGSLRGARGTLWSKAGNSLDRASLLIALLGASGISARYVHGTLPSSRTRQLILSMFSTPSRVAGCPTPGATIANPAADPSLLADLGDHYWVEYGTSFTPADPSFRDSQIGQVNGVAADRFTDIPASLRHTISLSVNVEQYQVTQEVFTGNGFVTSTVLQQTFDAADIVGKPLTFGHFVNSTGIGGIISTTIHTYTPYVRIGQDPRNPDSDPLTSGTDYQEIFTNFPLGSQVNTGVFLEIDEKDARGAVQHYERAMLDRIGIAVRTGQSSALPTQIIPPDQSPSFSELDFMTLSALPGLQDTSVIATYQGLSAGFKAQQQVLQPQLATVNTSNPSPQDQIVLQQATQLSQDLLITLGRGILAGMAHLSDSFTGLDAQTYYVKTYWNAPRLMIFSSRLTHANPSDPLKLLLAVDQRKDDIRVVAPPGQVANAPFQYNVLRGLHENSVEREVMNSIAGQAPSGATLQTNATDILLAAQAQAIGNTVLTASNASTLDTLSISADAKVRIGQALALGKVVVVPTSSVQLNGASTVAWLEHDPATGFTVDVTEDGGHQDIIEYKLLSSFEKGAILFAAFVSGFVAGFFTALDVGVILAAIPPLGMIAKQPYVLTLLMILASSVLQLAEADIAFSVAFVGANVLDVVVAFGAGFALGVFFVSHEIFHDPPAFSIASDLGPPAGSATPGSTPGVAATVIADTEFTVPFAGAQLPLAFDVQIQNLGPVPDTFSLTIPPISGYLTEQSLPAVLIPAGQTGQIGVCLVPVGQLPAPGIPVNLAAKVASTSNTAVTGAGNLSFATPAVQGVTVTATPGAIQATPGSSATTTLVVTSAGNTSVSANLTSTLSPGLSLSGLTTPVTLAAGQTSNQVLTLIPTSSASVNSHLQATINATFGSSSPPQKADQPAIIDLEIASLSAQAAFADLQAAVQSGRGDIGTVLANLGNAVNLLSANPTDAATKSEVLAYLDNLNALLNQPYLAAAQSSIASARAAIATSTDPTTLASALASLTTALSNLGAALSSPAAYPFDFDLIPNSATSQPNLPATFKIGLINKALVAVTYTFALSGVPAGVTGGLNTASVTLQPGQSIPAGNTSDPAVILTQSADLTTFPLTVTASVSSVTGSTQTASATLTARSQFLSVQNVVANPEFISPGATAMVTASLANVVNQNRTVNVTLTVLNSSNTVVLSPPPQPVTLSLLSLVTPVNFGTIAAQNLPAGMYTLQVTVTDPATNQTLPGGVGTGALLIGSPVTATLTVNPPFVPTGNSSVTSTLAVNTGGASRANPLVLLGSVATPSPAESLALNGNIAYLCDDNEVSVVNVADPTHPVLLNTAVASSIQNDGIIHCAIQRGTLVVFEDASNSSIGNNPGFTAFDISNPTQPTLIKGTPVNKKFFDEPSYVGNFAFVPTVAVTFFFGFQDDKFGDLVAVDVSDFTNPQVVGTLEQPQVDPVFGGHGNIWGGTLLNNTTMILGGSFSTGGGNSGPGRFQVADITNPASMNLLVDLPVPGTVELYTPLFQGHTAVAIADNAGWQGNFPSFRNGDPLVIVTFDITNPSNPAILATVAPANLQLGVGGGQARIGDNLFLFGQVQDTTGQQLLLLVDTTNPSNPSLRTFPIGTAVTRMVASGNILHTTSGAGGYAAYSIPGVGGGGQFTAQVQVPKGTGVNYDPASFNVAPTTITTGTSFDTLVWTNPSSSTITWNSNVIGSQPGQVRPVALSGLVSFTSPLGNGSVNLPQTAVFVDQILALSPPSLTVPAGSPASFTVTAKNPTSAPVTYNLAVTGVAPNWVNIPPTVTVPAAGSTNVTLTLQSNSTAAATSYVFVVTASTAGGTQGSVQGNLTLTGAGSPGPGAPGSTTALGVSLVLTPSQATVGQGGTASFVAQVTNVGNVADTYTLSAVVPSGVTALVSSPLLTLQPGLSNARQVNVQLTVAPGTAAGSVPFTVSAVSTTKSTVTNRQTGTLNISANGVNVALTPASVLQGGVFQMNVTNRGSVTDTFDLTLGGPAAVISTLATTPVTLAPNASQSVQVKVGPAPFASLGSLPLVAVATSRANTAVTANASASVTIPSTLGVTASFNPASQRLNALGSAVFLLQVQNTGTVEDAYSASIVSTQGPIQASLVGLDGNPTQTISTFRLPGVSTGQIVLNATLTGSAADGMVAVKIASLTNPAITAIATATLGLNKPFARAGKGIGINVLKNANTFLDGSASYDGGGAKLTYKWTLTAQPSNSHITTANIQGNGGPRPWVAPDQQGSYTFQLVVNNGLKDSDPANFIINVFNNHVPPTANAGKPLNAARNHPVTVDGSASANSPLNHPPKTNPLTYQWAFTQVPSGSHLTNSSLTGATQPKATFTPDVNGAYILTLTVNDGDNSSSDTVTVTVTDSNVAPNAVAGRDIRTLPNFAVNLDGSSSIDPDNGPLPLSFNWSFVFGALSNTAILTPAANKASFTPSAIGFYVGRLLISDGAATSGDNTTITVANTCDANADGVVNSIDLDLMAAFIGQTASPHDPLDFDKDGVITQADIDACSMQSKGNAVISPSVSAESSLTTAIQTAPLHSRSGDNSGNTRVRPVITSVLNAASMQSGALAPGEVIALAGSGFGGPAVFQPGIDRRVPNSLSGVRVLFDGAPSPVLMVGPTQVNVVVPYRVAGQAFTQIELVTESGASDLFRALVAESAPAVFTAPALAGDAGLSAVATNEDGTVNSPQTPAAAGSVITVFVNGAGQTIPPDTDGSLPQNIAVTSRLPMRVFLDGQLAEIVNVGRAPGVVSSILSVGIRVPPDLSSGVKTLAVQVGSGVSQPGITVAVR